MVVEVPGHQRDVTVTTLTNTLAIVQTLQYRDQPSGRVDELSNSIPMYNAEIIKKKKALRA